MEVEELMQLFTLDRKMEPRMPLLWLQHSQQTLNVRIYHDACVAEVMGYQKHRHFTSRYDYPNPDMFHKNEKQQLNKFLGEWLDHCLRNRCIFIDNIESHIPN